MLVLMTPKGTYAYIKAFPGRDIFNDKIDHRFLVYSKKYQLAKNQEPQGEQNKGSEGKRRGREHGGRPTQPPPTGPKLNWA
jgi:hypothetical protein